MDKTTTRAVVATLIRAGRRDLARHIVAKKKPLKPGYVHCPVCFGEGMVRTYMFGEMDWDVCNTCNGKGIVTKEEYKKL